MKKYQYLASWDDQTLTRVGEPVVVLGDSNVSQVEVILPSNFLLDPTGAVARMYFLLPGEKESDFETLETATKDENGDSHVTWTIKHVHSQKGGRLAFSLTLIGDDAQWDSRTAIIPVYESRYQPESEEAEEPYTGRLTALEGDMAAIRGEFAEVQDDFEELKETATLGTPVPKSLASEMVKGGVYLYTGTEAGYTAGHVYYYVGGALTDGGVYGGTAVDTTLTQSGQAADAAAVGAEVAAIKEDLSDLTDVFDWEHLATPTYPLGWRAGCYRASSGEYHTKAMGICSAFSVYIPSDSVREFTIKVPQGRGVSVSEYNFDTGYVGRTGSIGSANTPGPSEVTITPTRNCYYKFSVGFFNNDTGNDFLTQEFVDSIVLTEKYYANNRTTENKHLNICIFGNSYSADSWAYVPFILRKYGITCNIHFYYRGSGSVDRLVAEWEDRSATGLDDFGRSHVRRYTHIDTRYEYAWETVKTGISAKDVLEMVNDNPNFDSWDLIVLNAGSRSQSFTVAPGNGDPRKGAEPYLRQAIDLINASYNGRYHLAWFEDYTSFDGYAGDATMGYPAITPEEMDNRVGVLKSTETIIGAEPFDLIIPAGSAVFNARTNASLASTALSVTGNLWCSDKIHLQAGIPNYIANCTVVQSIFNKFYPHLSILGENTRITDELIAKYACPFITSWCGSVMDSTELLYELGQKAAFMACKYPYDITPIYLPTDDTALAWFDSHSNRYWADALISRPEGT